MLVSHSKKFIFLKTIKTGGTSVEIFFEEFCVASPVNYVVGQEGTGTIVSSAGIVGTRGSVPDHTLYYNHKPASELKAELGNHVWDSYFKFSIVRNPFDELISRFWWRLNQQGVSLINEDTGAVYDRFQKWVLTQGNINSTIYRIKDELEVDFLIRYEHLQEDIEKVCAVLGVSKNVSELGKFKSGIRPDMGELSRIEDYYDQRSIDHVMEKFGWEIERFKYRICQ
jgi:hypothetical protein